MGYDDLKMREIYEEENNKEMKLDEYYSENFQDLKDRLIEEDTFLRYLVNSDYREVKITKDRGDSIIIEGRLDFFPSEITFVNLKNKYPNSEIRAINYEGELKRYVVIEKAQFDKY